VAAERLIPWAIRVAVPLVVVGAVVLAWTQTRGEGAAAGPPQPVLTRVTLAPRTHLFGDPVTAQVEVAVDRRVVDPGSVEITTRFDPYTVAAVREERSRAGETVTVRKRATLMCITRDCLADSTRPILLELRPARITFRTRGQAASAPRVVSWPSMEVGSRLGTVVNFQASRVSPWRASLTPPATSYRARPALVAGVLFGAAGIVALLALALLWPELRRLLRVQPRRRDPLAGLPPLERALKLLELALAGGGADEQRKALDRLARELRRSGANDLAGAARSLAWSPSRPDRDELGAFAGRVAQAVSA
jgi:hypothetical protein